MNAEYRMTVEPTCTEKGVTMALKQARKNNLSTAIIRLEDDDYQLRKPNLYNVLRAVRKEMSHKWVKIVITTCNHKTYNNLVDALCIFFPKVKVVENPIQQSESDDDSEDEVIVQPGQMIPRVEEVEQSDDSGSEESDDDLSGTTSEEEVED